MNDLVRYDMTTEARREYEKEYSSYLDEQERIRDAEDRDARERLSGHLSEVGPSRPGAPSHPGEGETKS